MANLHENEMSFWDSIVGLLISAPSFYLIWHFFSDKTQFILYLTLMAFALLGCGIEVFTAIAILIYLVAIGLYNPIYALIFLMILSVVSEKGKKENNKNL